MSVNRQQSLFAAEDWQLAYQAFTQTDFQAYDFDTIRVSMVDYVRTNFPENFNDYIESSEFIAIIELLAYLSQALAFRMDVNTRENFLQTAERRDSVFKLARMVGYNPKRNEPARGEMKVVSVRTTEPVTDSLGNNLANAQVFWDDVNNPQSYEQFIQIMNAAMSNTNRFTVPVKNKVVDNIRMELYQINSTIGSPITYNSEIKVNGKTKSINIVNPDITDLGEIVELAPDPANRFGVIYKNDGKGISSARTGFFVSFQQGQMQFADFDFTEPSENRVQDLAEDNITENAVYLQEIKSTGEVKHQWQRVPNTVGQTLNYNSLALNTRKLYAIENQESGIRLRFSDGNFAEIPAGVFRLWYRQSEPSRFTIQPQDARNLNITIPYEAQDGREYRLTLTFSLQEAINNSSPAETLDQIRNRAPETFYTQDRMVSAQDYNVFPQSQSTNIVKIKTINRTHAGHSRYIDLNDPTGTFQNVDTFADDAYLYIEDAEQSRTILVNNNNTPREVVLSVLPESLRNLSVNTFVYEQMRNAWTMPELGGNPNKFTFTEDQAITWQPLPARDQSRTGFFTERFSGRDNVLNVLTNVLPETKQLKQNTFIKAVNLANRAEFKWVRIVSVENSGLLSSGLNTSVGPWELSAEVPAGWQITESIVSLRRQFTVAESNLIQNEIASRRTFGLGYDLESDAWYLISSNELTTSIKQGEFQIDSQGRGAASWLLLMEYEPVDQRSFIYNLRARGQNYVIQSQSDLKFYNVKNNRTVGSDNISSLDTITFTVVNSRPAETETFAWTGTSWLNEQVGTEHIPRALRQDLPLRTRDTTWRDVNIEWQSNFGILQPVTSNVEITASENRYVTPATVSLNAFSEVSGQTLTTQGNVVIPDNQGRIESFPAAIRISFTQQTFAGDQIVDESVTPPRVIYRQLPTGSSPGNEVIFVAELGEPAISFGVDGGTPDANTVGRLKFLEWNAITKQGLLEYQNLDGKTFHASADLSGRVSRDRLVVNYTENLERLREPVQWQIADVYQEPDGYIDARKVKVSAFDTDGDLVPDRPLQFSEYVAKQDLVLFEVVTDFDGFTQEQPVIGNILDFRNETTVFIDNGRDLVFGSNNQSPTKLSTLDWILLNTKQQALQFENKSRAAGLVVYVQQENQVYQVTPLSTDTTSLVLTKSVDHVVKSGRGPTQNLLTANKRDSIIRWQHIAPNDVRIDPSISNVQEMIVLTGGYNQEVQRWLARPEREFPRPPTSDQLNREFASLNTFKTASDSLVFRSAKFRVLFGQEAKPEHQVKFRVVKLSNQISDNELKTRIIQTINEYFEVENWEFGETFYFTELSTYIHQQLGGTLGSIVIIPRNRTSQFGDSFQIKSDPNELFLSTARVTDIEIVSRLDNQTLRTDR